MSAVAAARYARGAYILLFNFSWQGVMRHEKSLGRYCRWISRREHAPDAPRPTPPGPVSLNSLSPAPRPRAPALAAGDRRAR